MTEFHDFFAGKSDSADGVKPAVKYVPVMVCDEQEATGVVSEQTKDVAADAESSVSVPADSEIEKNLLMSHKRKPATQSMAKPFRQLTELFNMFQ